MWYNISHMHVPRDLHAIYMQYIIIALWLSDLQ